MHTGIGALLLISAAVTPLVAQTTPPAGAPGTQASSPLKSTASLSYPGISVLHKGDFAAALPLLEAELKAAPQSRDLLYAKVEALAGLGRFIEARSFAMQAMFSHPAWPEFRYQAGECSWNLGQAQQAVQAWTPLFSDPDWGGLAMAKASRALRASGREEEAKQLVLNAVAKQEKPSPVLLNEALELDRTGPGCIKIIDKLIAADPQSKDDYENLRKLYASIGDGKLLDESLSGSLPVTIPLKERSVLHEVGTLLNPGLFDNDILAKTDDVRTTRESMAPPQVGPPTSETIRTDLGMAVPVVIGVDKMVWMTLDSSTGSCSVSAGAAKAGSLGCFRLSGKGPFGEKTSRAAGDWVIIKKLEIGPVVFQNLPARVMQKNEPGSKDETGVFPLALLRHFGVLLDSPGGRVILYAPRDDGHGSDRGRRCYRPMPVE